MDLSQQGALKQETRSVELRVLTGQSIPNWAVDGEGVVELPSAPHKQVIEGTVFLSSQFI